MIRGPSASAAPRTRRAAAATAALLAAVLLSGCVTQQGGVTGKLGRAAEDVESALTSAELGLEQQRDGRTLPGGVDTLLEDMLDEVHLAAGDMGKASPTTAAELDRQRMVLGLAGRAEQVLATARGNLELLGSGSDTAIDADIRSLGQLAETIGGQTEGWTP